MADDDHEPEPTQTALKGLKIPVPKHEEFLQNLKKVAPPVESSPADEPVKK